MIVEMRIGVGTFLHMVTIVMHVTMRILSLHGTIFG